MKLTSFSPQTMLKGFLQTAEQFPILLWQLSLLAKVMCHPIYIESFQREPPIKIYRASDGGHKKVLSPISRLILWIMEADWERGRKEHWSFPLNFIFSKLCIFSDWGQERIQNSTWKPGSPISVLSLLFGLRISFTDWLLTLEMEEATKEGEKHGSCRNPAFQH